MARRKTLSFDQAITILGIDKYSSRETGQAAYRKLAAQYHPDKNSSADTVAKMAEINAAWSLLKTALPTQEQIDKKAEQAGAKEKQNPTRMEFSRDGLSVKLSGKFSSVDLIEALYAISEQHLTELGDVVKGPSAMVDLFRAFSTGRKHKVYSLALLDSKNRIIRTEELVTDSPDVKAVATQALLHGAAKVFLLVNSVDGSIPKSLTVAQKSKIQQLAEGLKLLGVEFVDYLVIGQAGYYSATESAVISKIDSKQHKAA